MFTTKYHNHIEALIIKSLMKYFSIKNQILNIYVYMDALVYYKIFDQNKSKFSPNSRKGTFLGFSWTIELLYYNGLWKL